ncbi:MAG: hypothetical protein EOO68_33190, partial [Moraxellaceae bacterium]
MQAPISMLRQKMIQACVVLWLALVCANSYAAEIQTDIVQADTVQADVVAQPTISNGTPATPTQVPWQAALYIQNKAGDT